MDNAEGKHKLVRGKPFVGKTWNGKPVILAEEYVEFEKFNGESLLIYASEILINANPSSAELFKIKLANPIPRMPD